MPAQQLRNGFSEPLQIVFQDFMADWVFSNQKSAQQVMETYFTPDYIANIDGHLLDHATFQSRIDRMRRDADVKRQEFHEMMEQGNRLFSMHTTQGISRSTSQPFETRAIAYFEFRESRIFRAYLNSVTLGHPDDADFASRS